MSYPGMITDVTPCGVTFSFVREEQMFFVHLYVNFDKEKIYGNTNIESYNIIVFDSNFNRIEYDDDIYPAIEKVVIDQIINEDY